MNHPTTPNPPIRRRAAPDADRTHSRRTLRATTLWGRLTEIPYSSITGAKAGSIEGLPVLLVASSELQSPLYIYTLGLDRDAVHSHLYMLIGADNPRCVPSVQPPSSVVNDVTSFIEEHPQGRASDLVVRMTRIAWKLR
jgi:hypothetical protein